MTSPHASWLFVVDSDTYAGNFERDLCAYLTGRVGECGVGADMVTLFTEETGLEPFENVIEEPDEHGCSRPATIYPTPGWFNHGSGGHFRDGDESAAVVDYRRACREIYEDYMRAPQRHLVTLVSGTAKEKAELARLGWTAETAQAEIDRHQREIDKADALTVVHKWPACLSVAISFETEPTADQIALMKERAGRFALMREKSYGGEPAGKRIETITGFRLIRQTRQQDITIL